MSPPTEAFQVPNTPDAVAVDGYEFVRELARGEESSVYVARVAKLGYEVAIKITRYPEPAFGKASSFVAKARLVASLQHPGIPLTLDLGRRADGQAFLVMKLVEGRTLADILAERPKPITDRIRFLPVFEQICQTMAFVHTAQVVHGNLKPEHVMIGSCGEVQVIGWGSATPLAGSRAAATATHQAPSAALAPEHAASLGNSRDCRDDVLALGGILLEILVGRSTSLEKAANGTTHAATNPTSTTAFAWLDACGEDPDLIALAKRCLSPSPAPRPGDARELATLISNYRANLEVRARTSAAEAMAATAIATERSKRRQLQLILLLVVGLCMIWAGAMVWWQDRQNTRQRILNDITESLPPPKAREPQERVSPPKKVPSERDARIKQQKRPEVPIIDEHLAPPPRMVQPPGP
jgi:serine/threonine-protein kinase